MNCVNWQADLQDYCFHRGRSQLFSSHHPSVQWACDDCDGLHAFLSAVLYFMLCCRDETFNILCEFLLTTHSCWLSYVESGIYSCDLPRLNCTFCLSLLHPLVCKSAGKKIVYKWGIRVMCLLSPLRHWEAVFLVALTETDKMHHTWGWRNSSVGWP